MKRRKTSSDGRVWGGCALPSMGSGGYASGKFLTFYLHGNVYILCFLASFGAKHSRFSIFIEGIDPLPPKDRHLCATQKIVLMKNEVIVCLACTSVRDAGLFFHVGYSVVERHVIETNSNLRLDSDEMLHKLTALLHDPTSSPSNQVSERDRISSVYE